MMTTKQKATSGKTWKNLKVKHKDIQTDEAFKTRADGVEEWHVKTLMMALNRGSILTPIVLWERGTGDLVLLDGEHRLAAYEAVRWTKGIPARVVSCTKREAFLITAGGNTKDSLALTYTERANLAWRLVREPDVEFSKRELSIATGVSDRTVANMRARWKALKGTDCEPCGQWWRDRLDRGEFEGGEFHEMTDEEFDAEAEAIARRIRKAIGNIAYRNEQLFTTALDKALGGNLRRVADNLYPSEELEEWRTTFPEDYNGSNDAAF